MLGSFKALSEFKRQLDRLKNALTDEVALELLNQMSLPWACPY
jgi:hypothetical protein